MRVVHASLRSSPTPVPPWPALATHPPSYDPLLLSDLLPGRELPRNLPLIRMWSYSSQRKYRYSLQWADSRYTFLITDMHTVYAETLSISQISARGGSQEFALENETQVAKFCGILREMLSTEAADFDLPSVHIRAPNYIPPLHWEFQLTQLNDSDTSRVFSAMAQDFLGVVKNLGETIDAKNMVIRGLDDAVQRKVEYRVPRHLDSAFRNRQVGLVHSNELALAEKYWPADSTSLGFMPATMAHYEETIDTGSFLESDTIASDTGVGSDDSTQE